MGVLGETSARKDALAKDATAHWAIYLMLLLGMLLVATAMLAAVVSLALVEFHIVRHGVIFNATNLMVTEAKSFILPRIKAKLTFAVWRDNLIALGLIMIIVIVDAFIFGWSKSSIRRLIVRPDKSAIEDILFTVILFTSSLGMARFVFTLGLSLVAGLFVKDVLASAAHIHFHLNAISSLSGFALVPAVLIYWIFSDFNNYWFHRLQHTEAFWPLHRIHHSATNMNVLTTTRGNPGDGIFSLLYTSIPLVFLAVLDVPAGMLFYFSLFSNIVVPLAHSRFPWRYGWVGRWIIVSPVVHQLHHSMKIEHRDRNFGFCPLWDRIFGTWYEGPEIADEFGVPEDAYNELGFVGKICFDLKDFYPNLPRRLAMLITPPATPSRAGDAKAHAAREETEAASVT